MLPEEIKKERKSKTPEQALAALMRLAARAEKSSGDALRLMRTWGVPPTQQQGVLQKLQAAKFIDDERYARAFVREKSRLNGWGTYKIRAALARKGIARTTADAALALLNPEASRDRLAEQLARKARTAKYSTPHELRTKLIRYGLSLGYEYNAVREATSQFINNDECNEFSEF